MALIKIITLGCSKNTVDSEVLMGNLQLAGHQIINEDSPKNPEVVIVNTCGFIGDAKQEAINVILQLDYLKRKQRIGMLYVMGCLVERHQNELKAEFPSVDAWYGVHQMEDIVQSLSYNNDSKINIRQRALTTPSHYAYLKIAEGCDRACSFCAIPLIRGKHISRSIEDLLDEARELAEKGAKELILISQDVTCYGVDLYKEKKLADLLNALVEIDGIEWIRLQYLYPHQFPMEVLNIMRENPKVCRYIDIPFQHISTRILQSMKRATTKEETCKLIEQFREKVPDAALRTTLIVGYPGETEEEFEELKTFVKDSRFDRLGVFKYSAEEGTSSFELNDDVPDDVKEKRMSEIMEIQEEISTQKNEDRIGRIVRVLADRFEGEYIIGRTEFDSPEVDNEVLILDEEDELELGEFYDIKITEANAFDIFGERIN